MPTRAQALKQQLDLVYDRIGIKKRRGEEQVVFGEGAFGELLKFIEMVPEHNLVGVIFRLSPQTRPLLIAAVFNILLWSADGRGSLDLEAIAEWFYSGQAKKIEIALQVDIFPSNSMEESKRILAEIERKFPHLSDLCQELLVEVNNRLAEEESWAKYRRDTFEMPQEMTGSIMGMIRKIKGVE